MGYQTWIANQCRKFGLQVEEYAGWTTRGSSSFNPQAALAHWTAGPCGATGRPSLNICVNGRSGIPGPLCNVYLDRIGTCVIVAAGRANHAGTGGWRGLSGNSSVLGVEAECCNAGDWTELQRLVYPTLMAALVTGIGRDETWIGRHCDWTTRKIDTNDLSLAWFQSNARIQINRVSGGGGAPTPTPPSGPPPAAVGKLLWPLLTTSTRSAYPTHTSIVQQVSGAAVDGDYYNATAKAVSGYQGANGLGVDGKVGQQTGTCFCQNVLRDLGHYGGALDGLYGPNTTTAVKNFQARTDVNLPADGIIGDQTTAALWRLCPK